MSKPVNVLNYIITVLENKLAIKVVRMTLIVEDYTLEIHSKDGKTIVLYINKYNLEYLKYHIQVYYYTKLLIHTVSRMIENA